MCHYYKNKHLCLNKCSSMIFLLPDSYYVQSFLEEKLGIKLFMYLFIFFDPPLCRLKSVLLHVHINCCFSLKIK